MNKDYLNFTNNNFLGDLLTTIKNNELNYILTIFDIYL